VTIQTVINEFSTWLSKFDNVFLVAHDGRRFGFPVLVSTHTSTKRVLESVIPKLVSYFESIKKQ